MAFIVEPAIWDKFPDMLLMVVSGNNLDNRIENSAVKKALGAAQEQLRNSWPYPNAQSHPYINAWRQAFKKIGISGGKFPSAIEALVRRALSGGEINSINPLVDFYNTISLIHTVPIGSWDIEGLAGSELYLRITEGGEPFKELGGEETIKVNAGEVSYTDLTEVITRHFVWRQAEKAKIIRATRRFFLVSEILPEVGLEVAQEVQKSILAGLKEFFGIEANSTILDATSLKWNWN